MRNSVDAASRVRALVCLALLAGVVALATAHEAVAACPVDLFREYNPTSPPAILTDPPIRQIDVSPYVEPDPEPVATTLTYYRLNTRVHPDPDVSDIFAIKSGGAVAIIWTGGGDPGACCVSAACSDLCEPVCIAAGGIYQGAGTSCSDLPPHCGSGGVGEFFGMAKENGGGVSFFGSGIPTLLPVTAQDVDAATGASTALALTLSADPELVWNFTGARHASSDSYYYIAGKFGDAGDPATVVTIDMTGPTHVGTEVLTPERNLLHIDVDQRDGTLYGLVSTSGNLNFGGGRAHFTSSLDLVTIDPTNGTVTTIATGLPTHIEDFAATIDSVNGLYYYHTFLEMLHAVDLVTGGVVSVASPGHYVDLQSHEVTGALYGLSTTGTSSFSASGTDGFRTFFNMDLAELDPATGAGTILNAAPLPTGITNWAGALDPLSGHYLYVSDTGEAHVLDTATGMLLASSPPPVDAKLHSLD